MNELPGMFLLFHVPRSFSETEHNLRVNDVFNHALQLRAPKNPNDDVIFINVGEIVPRVFKPSGEAVASASPEQLCEWSHGLSQAAFRAVENISVLRTRANNGDLFKEITRLGHEDETLSGLAKDLAQLSEAGTFVMSASTGLGVDV